MKLMKWQHEGFHGTTAIRVMVPDDAEPLDPVEVSERVARRLNNAVCGIDECQCGYSVAYKVACSNARGYRWWVTIPKEASE